MINSTLLFVCLFVCVALAQRPPYAGTRPSGYKDRLNLSTVPPTGANVPLDNRFGANDASVQSTTQKLPNLALGDAELVNRLNQLPIDQRPFWLINSEAIEAQKNGGVRPAVSAPSIPTSGFISSSGLNRPQTSTSTVPNTSSQNPAGSNAVLANRFGEVNNNVPVNSNNVISQYEIVYPVNDFVFATVAPVTADRRQNLALIVPQLPPVQSLPNVLQSQPLPPVQTRPVSAGVINQPQLFDNGDYDDYFN